MPGRMLTVFGAGVLLLALSFFLGAKKDFKKRHPGGTRATGDDILVREEMCGKKFGIFQ